MAIIIIIEGKKKKKKNNKNKQPAKVGKSLESIYIYIENDHATIKHWISRKTFGRAQANKATEAFECSKE